MSHSQIVSFIWGVADLIRDTFKRGKYLDVILLFTVLRRIDCVIAPTKERVLERHAQLKRKLAGPRRQLCRTSGLAFYNTSRYDFARLLANPLGRHPDPRADRESDRLGAIRDGRGLP